MNNFSFPDILKPLVDKKIKTTKKYRQRVISFDISEINNNFEINHYKRFQSIPINSIFPNINNLCGCGCGGELSGRRKRWYSDECSSFAEAVRDIICGRSSTIMIYLKLYHNAWECCKCKSKSDIKIDHIIPVKHGGGGCWLSNYQLLCHNCHVNKTNEDFGWKQKEKQ